ncbi:hypothetical protein BT69DRAFT_359364 [Atractiella rhizophila]|nr:hypothetical protein BT69DRAFT_359364 [Atractiella rhizophila]
MSGAPPSLAGISIPSGDLFDEGASIDKPNTPDETPISPTNAAAQLEKRLDAQHRSTKEELVNRNILRESKVAPALQEKQKTLEESQLKDRLKTALEARPEPEKLVQEGILQEGEVPGK